ncbi:MAG TPA: hypothetical protein PLL06_10855, partial [Acidobacteriota bacterium]|nr:hypothetical protein [Acidobacteriota bacterium]
HWLLTIGFKLVYHSSFPKFHLFPNLDSYLADQGQTGQADEPEVKFSNFCILISICKEVLV